MSAWKTLHVLLEGPQSPKSSYIVKIIDDAYGASGHDDNGNPHVLEEHEVSGQGLMKLVSDIVSAGLSGHTLTIEESE